MLPSFTKKLATPLGESRLQVCFFVLQALVLCGLGLALYGKVLVALFLNWASDVTYSHGYIVPVFTAYLIYRRRSWLRTIVPRSSWTGLPLILFALAMLIVGELSAELFMVRISLLLLIAGAVIFFGGWEFFRAVLYPWLTLFLMIPLPGIIFHRLTFPLQLFASESATWILEIAHIPVLRNGNILELAQMRLEVAEACSGIRSLISIVTFAVIIGYYLEKRNSLRLCLVLSSIPVAVAANSIRIILTGILCSQFGPTLATGFFHEFSGWVTFMAAVLCLLIVQWALHEIRAFFRTE